MKLTANQVVTRLNKLVVKDPKAFTHLVDLRVDCGPLYIAKPKTPVKISFYGRPLIGLLEVLNMLFDNIAVVKSDGIVTQFKCCRKGAK